MIDQSHKPAATASNGGPCPSLTADPHCPYMTGKKPTTYYSTFYNSLDPGDYFVENGTYMRIRELAVNWQLPASWIAKLPGDFHTARFGIVGRNLWTNTKYNGYNPDVSGVTGRAAATRSCIAWTISSIPRTAPSPACSSSASRASPPYGD